MNKIYLIIFMLFFPFFNGLTAQSNHNYTISYSHHIKYDNPDSIQISKEFKDVFINNLLEKKYFELILNNEKSEFYEVHKINNNQADLMFQVSSPNSRVFKDRINNIVFYEMNFPKKMLVYDSIRNFNWEISDKNDTIIHGYNSFLAKSNLDDRDIKVYFTNQIPIADGPSEYYGLPGLILYVEDKLINKNEIFVYEFESLSSSSSNNIKFPSKKMISMEEYVQIINDFFKKQKDYHSNSIE